MNKGTHALSLKEEGKTNQEIADELGMSAKSVRRLVSEARTQRSYRESLAGITRDGDITSRPILPHEWGQVKPGTFRDLPADWAPPGYTRRTFPQDDHLLTAVAPVAPRRHFFIPDPQARPDENLDHMRWIGEYAAEQEPDVIVNAGDHWDMASLSSYEKPGSKYFEGRRVLADIEAGNRANELFEEGMARRARAGWRLRRVMLRGNHEDRITRMLNDNPTLEGVIGFDKFNDVPLGWEVFDYRVPVEIDGLTYSHLFYNPGNGRPYSGNVETMIKNIGFSFVQGHQQGLRWGRRELGNGKAQTGLIAGSSYLHEEEYRGPQAKVEWRGVCVLHEVADGSYDPMFVSMNYLRRKFGP